MLSSSPKQLFHEWAMHFPNPPVSTYAIACTWLFPPSLLPVEIPHLLQGTAHILLLPWCPVLVMILLKILNLAFEHRAPFYCILYTWCYYRLPSCHLVLFFEIDVLLKFYVQVYVLPHSVVGHSILGGRHLERPQLIHKWKMPWPRSQNFFPLLAL